MKKGELIPLDSDLLCYLAIETVAASYPLLTLFLEDLVAIPLLVVSENGLKSASPLSALSPLNFS